MKAFARRIYRTITGKDAELESIKADLTLGFSRASATAAARVIDRTNPRTWEFSGFSQHGEDGIVDYLCENLTNPTKFFFEIGGANGIENCTAWLAYARSFGGVWVEGSPALCARAKLALQNRLWNVHVINRYVDVNNIGDLLKMCPYPDPDVFSVDIDGIDYYIVEKILSSGLRPKIWIVEYNSVFGPEKSVTVNYADVFNRWAVHSSGLYYGVSVNGYRKLFEKNRYKFITVEASGTNAFFVDPSAFPENFFDGLRSEHFAENSGDANGGTRPYADPKGHLTLPLRNWEKQYAIIKDMPLVEID